ncbi:MAG: hypothetical protein ACRC46_05975 [Thermoguttaceae bacterium]
MPHLDAISFFVLVLLICPAVLAWLWRIRYRDAVRFAAFWFLLTVAVLVINQMGREMLDPGRWAEERLLSGVDGAYVVGSDAPAWNLLGGWFLFPMRVFPHVRFHAAAIVTSAVTLLLATLVTHGCGRLIIGNRWTVRASFTTIGTLITLYAMSFTTIGIVRQVGWIVNV